MKTWKIKIEKLKNECHMNELRYDRGVKPEKTIKWITRKQSGVKLNLNTHTGK